jgi:hypothetical protein
MRARHKPPVALVAPGVSGRGGDQANLGQRDRPASVEHQAVMGAPRDLPDVLAAVVQPDDHALLGAHRPKHAQHQLVGLPPRRRGRPRTGHALGWLVGADGVADLVVQRERSAQEAANVLAHLDVLDLVAVDAVQQPAGLLGALGRVLRQVACAPAPLALITAEPLDVNLGTPAHDATAKLVGSFHADRRDGAADRHRTRAGARAPRTSPQCRRPY